MMHACSICNVPTLPVGRKDFAIAGNDRFMGRRTFPDSGVLVEYRQCVSCGFMYTGDFDAWTDAEWRENVYNRDYIYADPPFAGERAARYAQLVTETIPTGVGRLLDYGSGDGGLATRLQLHGYDCTAWDYHHAPTRPAGRFEAVLCIEVLEHIPHGQQRAWAADLASLLQPGGLALVTTELCDGHSLDWWYACPRNGHISLHSSRSLAKLLAAAGLILHIDASGQHLVSHQPKGERHERRAAICAGRVGQTLWRQPYPESSVPRDRRDWLLQCKAG